jgi:hypothetical protein
MDPQSSGPGYLLVGSDGGIFAFGGAFYNGSMAQQTLAKLMVATVAS